MWPLAVQIGFDYKELSAKQSHFENVYLLETPIVVKVREGTQFPYFGLILCLTQYIDLYCSPKK